MKILFITHYFYPKIGGIEVNSEILASKFFQAGEDVHLVTWTLDSSNKVFPYTVIRKPSVKQLVSEHRWADVVFENNPTLRLSWPALLFKKDIVIAIRTWISRTDGDISWQDKLKFAWLKRASAVIAVSEQIRKETWPAAMVIGNPYRNLLFRILPSTDVKREFVFLGRLVSDKGADMAISAFAKIIAEHDSYKNITLTIIGDGPEEASLRKMATILNVDEQVNFVGPLVGEKLVECLNNHRFIIVPSRWKEPFGNVALEGMACGCIPIVSNGGGLPDAVGKAGLVFDREDMNGLINCMIDLLVGGLETELKEAAAIHLKDHRPDIVARRYLDVISRVVNNRINK